ncbi:MAG: hypothetical protein H0W36_06240 [Gemmatimonadetes bacterium]|nr:hypothetical protein [Gemmatimonadota bacterium]
MNLFDPRARRAALRAAVMACAVVTTGSCADDDRLGPPSDLVPGTPEQAAASTASGIMFASFALKPAQLTTVHTGIVGPSSPSQLRDYLSQVRARGGRVLVRLAPDGQVKNADGTFNLTKYKAALDRYRNIDFAAYIADGTMVGHFVLDEPQFPSRWGGTVIPQATVEAAARHSKQLWPTLPTIVNAPAQWLAASTVTYTHLDAGWAMFRAGAGSSPTRWAANQVSKAQSKGLGLFAGLNVLDGGDGSSGFRGNYPQKWAMSALELRTYGSALLAQSYVCGFGMWEYRPAYYDRADIRSAMADLSAKARSHARTSCRQ